MTKNICAVDNCNRAGKGKYCTGHYARLRTHGDVFADRPIVDRVITLNGLCILEQCERPSKQRGYCAAHYTRLIRWGDLREDLPIQVPIKHGPVCSAEGCERPSMTAGLCRAHHSRRVRTGDVQANIPLRKSRPVQPPGTKRATKFGYVRIKVGVDSPYATLKNGWAHEHHYVMAEHLGRPLFPHEEVHHLNGVRDDNRLENLELWTTSQPRGQRLVDKIAWAKELLEQYPELL